MATFKVGQRVRVVGQVQLSECFKAHIGAIDAPENIGREAVILAALRPEYAPLEWQIGVDGKYPLITSLAASSDLAPLTDPKADEFIERVKKWKPEPMTHVEVDAAMRRLLGVK